MNERVQITLECELPQGETLERMQMLLLHQMRTRPEWSNPVGTGHLNHVCFDQTMRVVMSVILPIQE